MSAPNAKLIKTDPDPLAPFRLAQGYQVGDVIYLSGQAAIDLEGNIVGAGDFDAQAAQVFENIALLLKTAGSSMEQIVKVTIYLIDMANFPKIIELRGQHFTPPYPADTIVQVASLALPELMIEIDVIALRQGRIEEP